MILLNFGGKKLLVNHRECRFQEMDSEHTCVYTYHDVFIGTVNNSIEDISARCDRAETNSGDMFLESLVERVKS